MAISEKEYLILSDLAYDNLVKAEKEHYTLSDMYFDENGKLRSNMMDKKNVDSKTDSALGINRYDKETGELKTGFQGVLESKDYKEVMSKWKVIAVSNEQENSGYYGVAFQNEAGEIVFANRGTEPAGEQKKKDLVITDGQIFSSYYPNQFEDAMKFYNQVKGLSIANGKMINVTGHSLGGGISQYIGVMGDNVGEVVTWNGVGANQKKIDQYDFWGLSRGSNYIYENLVRLNYIENNQVTENFKFELNNIFDDVSNVF